MTQTEQVRKHLENFGSLTPLEALDLYGTFRLGARVLELRQAGLPILTERFKTPGGAVVAKYVLSRPKVPRDMTEQMAILA